MKNVPNLNYLFTGVIIAGSMVVSSFFNQVFAQPAIQWSKCYGGPQEDNLFELAHTADGGVVIAGSSSSVGGDVTLNLGYSDYWIVKLDTSGLIQWQKSYGGSVNEEPFSVIQTSDGGYAITGNTTSFDGYVSGYHGYNDLWVLRLDSNGQFLWQKCLGGTVNEDGYSILETNDKGFIVAGRASSIDGDVIGLHDWDDYWIVRLDSSGNVQWRKCFGGSRGDFARSIVSDGNGGFTILGSASSSNGDVMGIHPGGTFFDPTFDFWLINIDSVGILQWQKCFGGTNNEYAAYLQKTSDNGYIMLGSTTSDDGDVTNIHSGGTIFVPTSDLWVVKTDVAGNIQWQKCIGGSENEWADKVIQRSNGEFIVSGITASANGDVTNSKGLSDGWIVNLDSIGNILWQTCIGGRLAEYQAVMDVTTNGKISFGVSTNSNDYDIHGNHGDEDFFVGVFSNITASNFVKPICTSCNGSITVSPGLNNPPYTYLWSDGQTTATADFLCAGNYTVTVTNSIGVSSEGSFCLIADTLTVNAVQSPASCWNCPDGSATLQWSGGSGINSVYWIGYSDTTLTLSGLPHGWVTGCTTDVQGCVACDSIEVLSPVGIFENEDLNASFRVYPNPTKGLLTIRLSDMQSKLSHIEIYNAMGEMVINQKVENYTYQLDMTPYSQGIYFVRGFDQFQKYYTQAFQFLK